jgi:hypothetical protein
MWFTQSITTAGIVWILFCNKFLNKKNKPIFKIHFGIHIVSFRVCLISSIRPDIPFEYKKPDHILSCGAFVTS